MMLKDYRFTVRTHGATRRIVTAESGENPALAVATPPEFRGGVAGVWSPEVSSLPRRPLRSLMAQRVDRLRR
jgi:hypothetical protein